jgi:hypothetical protein
VLFEAQTGGARMFTGQGASLARRRLLRFWSMTLSAVLAITLLQVAPPAKAAAPLFVDLVTRADGVGESVLLGETSLSGVQASETYRLDIQVECGLLDYIDDNSSQVINTIMGNPVAWTSQGINVALVGMPSELEQALDNLRIIQAPSDFGPPLNCDASIVQAWLAVSTAWAGNYDPQGRAGYYLVTPSPIPVMFDHDDDQSVTSPRLIQKSDGFEVEWNEYLGATGFTPSGFTLRYRDVTNSGPWIYQTQQSGDYVSAVVSGLGDAGVTYEAQIAPMVRNCDGITFYGLFSYMANGISQFGIEPTADAVGTAITTGHEVASQCFAACTPVESVEFDGTNLATIFRFTNTDPCTWTVPSNLTSTTVDAYVVGGGGGGGAAGGGGGGGGGFETSIGLPIAIGDTWTVRVGAGGAGSDIAAPRGDIGNSSSVSYPESNGEQTITAPGGGGGGTKDNSGHTSGGDGIYSSVPLSLTFGGAGSGSQGTEGIGGTTVENKYYGAGGNGGNGSTSGTTFIEGVFASGGGGGAVCSSIDALNYPGGTSQNGGSGGYCGGNSQPGSRDGNDAFANSGSGGGGGASDADGNDGAGGDGGSGVVYIVHTEAPTARYLPSSCIVDLSGNCASWENTTSLDPSFTATVTGAPVVTSTSNPALNGSTLQSSIPVVQGTPSDSIVFPASAMPDNYTLFTVARYNEGINGTYRRIFDGTDANWLSGFHGGGTPNGKSGIAFHGEAGTSSADTSWMTPYISIHNFDWVISTDQENLYRSNGTTRSYEGYSGGTGPGQLTINAGASTDERSDFQVADIITFGRELNEEEYRAVEVYLSGEYGICAGNCSSPVFSTTSPLPDGETGTAYSQTITATSPDGNSISYAVLDTTPLPVEFSFNTITGELTGTPATYGEILFTIEATDVVTGRTTLQDFAITVNDPPEPQQPVFSTTSPLQGGVSGTPYSQTITATGPVGHSISYAVVDILNFPPGLSLDPTSGDISGTPTTAGEYTFTVEATDSVNGENTREDFTITVATLNSHESDVDFGGFEWLRVGAGIGNIVTDIPSEGEPPAILGSGSMRAYWIPNVDADPLTDGIEITCADTSDSSVTTSDGYSILTCEEMDLSSVQSGLTAQLIRNFAASDPWHQISIKLDNDLTESVTGAIAYRIDLASGSNTEIEMTSDGDLILDSTDKWFVTTDNSDTNRPASLHYFGTTGGQVYEDGPDSDAGKFWIKKPFTVNSESIQTHRFIDGFTKLGPQETTGEAVIVAMKAADELEHQQWDSSSNILSSDISDVISEDRDLPSLRIQYECRDFGRNLLYPVLVQNDGQPIGCSFSDDINEGLFPSQAQTNKDDDWKRLFKSTFPNATPRLGWACDTCVITSEGPVEPGLPGSAIADGLPLGFLTSIDGDVVDSIRISPKGFVQLHESGDEFATNGHMVAAFANQELNNGILQGEWSQLPDFDFFYWGRTEYQGRLAFVVTWVMIPTLDNEIVVEDPTTMQLMFVSDRTESTLGDYFENPDDASVSNVDIVWNFHSIQGEGSSGGIVSSQPPLEGESDTVSTYSGIFDSQLSGLTLISDAFMSDNQTGFVGNGSSGSVDCDASCVAGNLLTNRLQSPVDGRYVLGYRTYKIVTDEGDGPPYIPVRGMFAPAAPRDVEVVRTVGSSATVSWRAPLPWVLRTLEFPDGTNPIYGYRVEYAVNTRGESTECGSPGPGPLPQGCAVVFPDIESLPLSASDESLIVLGPDDTERISITIPELDEREQYTFRVFAVYSGLEFPNSDEMPIETMEFYSEVRSAPATANEIYESDLEIVTAASQPSQAFAAEGLAEMLSGNLEVSNATINGSPYPYGQTEKSVGSFTGGETSIGFDSGIILTPLVDARTFQRGSGITTEDSDSKFPRYFLDPDHRSKYEQIATDFAEFMSRQKSWVPGDDYSGVFDCEEDPDCAFGTTTLQFDIEKPAENDFLKFEYVLAGLESTTFSEGSGIAEVYNYPDGFGLFVGGIDQASSCALVPQTDSQTDQERFMSMGNALNSRLASEVGFDSDLNSETVTSVMSCVFDVSEIESDSVTVTMAIANANDENLSTAVFLKTDSIRFEEISINTIDIPAATEGQDYEPLTFTTSGSTPPHSWLAEGLPEGMELTASGELTGSGDLTGRPTESGSFNFTVIAKDINNVVLATQAFTILVEPSPVNVLQTCDNPETTNFVTMFSNGNLADGGQALTDTSVGGEDANLRNALCTSYDVTVFDGGSYSVSDWTNALEGAAALVFPEMNTGNNLFSTEINATPLFSDELLDYLREWNSAENPVIFTGSDTHLFDMQTMIGSDLPLTSSQGGSGDLSYSRLDGINDEAPESLDSADAVAPMQFSDIDETGYGLLISAGFRPIYGAIEGPTSGLVAVSSFSSESPNGHLVYQFGFDWSEGQPNDATLAWAEVLSMAISDDLLADSGDRFLQGQYVEVGIAGNGRFGSSGAAPSGYHPRDPGRGPESGPSQRRIGFVSDRDKDGWGVGQVDGDFFIPGDPFEGFGIDVGGNSYFNNDEDTDIARLSEVTDTNSDRQQSTWTSEEMPNGLQVTQVAAVPVNDQRLDVTVTLTNTSDVVLEDVYYARQVDNDANVYACQENEGGWRSLNKVVAQANSDDKVSLVSSIMMDDCNDEDAPTDLTAPHSYLGMVSTDPNSVAALQGFDGFGPQQAIDFVNGVSEEECQSRGDSEMGYPLCLPVMIDRGSQVFGDAGIGLGFDLGTIEAGGSKTITFSYILSANQAQDIIDQHNIDNDIVAPAITTVGEPALRALIGRSFESATSTWVENTGGSISYYTISPELPDGLSLNSETGDISGTPTATMETTSFTLTANNLAGSSSVSFALEIEESIDCRSNPEADLKVVLLRKISANPSTENNSTVNEIDTNIAQTLCRSSHIDLTLFRGGDGSPEAWDAALTGKDVLVLPATTFDLVGSNLMSSEALTWITIWMRQGGRVVVTDSSQHAIELERLLGLTQDPLDFMTSNDSHVDNNQAPTAMPERLVLSDSDNSSHLLLLPTGSHTNEMLDIGLDSINIYGTSIDLDQELISASAATQFGVDRGHVIQISSNYSGEVPSASWNKLLLASVYGTPTRYLGINEPDATWVLSGSELYWDEMNPAAIISLGNGLSRDAVRCVNVPSSPSIRKVTALGTEVKCGSYRLFDGITDSGVQIQLKRFFSANAAWLGSKVEISNLDTENTYSNSIYYGGSQGQNSTMQIEATNDVTHNLSNLNSYMQEPHWYITSRGESISRDADGPEGKIVTTVLGPDNFASYGGSDRYSLPLLGNDEILSEKTMEIDGLESRSFTFFTGLTEYEPGCDRLAVSTSKTAAAALNSQFDPDLRWPDFDEISFPELSTSECESYFDQVSGMSISQRNEVVSVSWPRLPNADMYELQFQLLGQDSWSSSLYQSSSEDIESIWNFTNLNEGAVYNFRIRPIEINRNSSSDNANGRWLLTDPGFTVETWSSPTPSPSSSSGSPSPSPSNSPSPSQPPVVNNPGPDLSSTIVPQMIAQTGPGFPARLKRGKTVKFGMTAPSGLPLQVTSVGQCKTTKITKTVTVKVLVGKKIKKKKVKMQTGWAVKATKKKGLCTVTFSNSGDATRNPLAAAGTITVF